MESTSADGNEKCFTLFSVQNPTYSETPSYPPPSYGDLTVKPTVSDPDVKIYMKAWGIT